MTMDTQTCIVEPLADDRLAKAKQLVRAIENGNEDESDRLIDEISTVRETMLFQSVGKLTRQLHDAMTGFTLDSKITALTNTEIPDAKERLNYVIAMTEEAANTTLNAMEELIPLSAQMENKCDEFSDKWQRFCQKEMQISEFNAFSQELFDFLSGSKASNAIIQTKLNEVLMAQGFQDITGQIIRRVIGLVHDVQQSLVELIKLSGSQVSASPMVSKEDKNNDLAGPAVPGVSGDDTMNNQDDVDDLLSSLGF